MLDFDEIYATQKSLAITIWGQPLDALPDEVKEDLWWRAYACAEDMTREAMNEAMMR